MNISKHITLTEATKSNTATRLGINNTPNEATIETMKLTAEKVFEPLREILGAIRVSSFYRSPDLNRAIGGSKSSQHCKGEAIDIDMDGTTVTNKQVFDFIKDNVNFDQLIWEFGTDANPDWVHVSYESTGKQRKQILKAVKVGGATKYVPYK
jgi:NADH dehydrogenase FAD-containing subunit